MTTFSILKEIHPCIPCTLIPCASLSLYIAIKGITLTYAAASTASLIMSLVGVYFCVSTLIITKKIWDDIKYDKIIDDKKTFRGRYGLVYNEIGETVKTLLKGVLFLHLALNKKLEQPI